MRTVLATLFAVVAGFVVGALIGAGYVGGGTTTLVSLSPDERIRVHLVERSWRLDRNFDLIVEQLPAGDRTVVFTSPDEGRPVGTERIVWSRDSSRFLLLGRHFYVAPEAWLDSGEALYLLYDVPAGRLWCNAIQKQRHPGFGPKALSGLEWQASGI